MTTLTKVKTGAHKGVDQFSYVERLEDGSNKHYTAEDAQALFDSDDATSGDFAGSVFETESVEFDERAWRDSQLKGRDVNKMSYVDLAVNISSDADDSTQLAKLKTYRQALRDWPAHADFPDSAKRPTL